jgi:signal transduction histidine kinase
MFGLPASLALALIAAMAVLFAWRLNQKLSFVEAAALRKGHEAAMRGRTLGLLVQELRAAGLSLLGHGGTLPPAVSATVAAEADRLLRLADNLSDWLAAEAGPRVLRPERLALQPLIEETVAMVAAQLGPGQRHWRLSPDFAPLILQADRRALRAALHQVLARAARMTRDGDWIDLRPVLTPESLAIVVEDEGAGLPAEDLAAGAEGTRGLCFGLAVARSLLEAHGGGLRIESARGIGARAWLTLPRERAPGLA